MIKQVLIILTLIFTSTQGFGQSKVATINVRASIYCDHCKQCESCGARLEQAVYSEKGIKRVDLDEKQKTLNIIYNPNKTSPDKIRKAISKAGFDADNVKADPKAYARLDECCRKQ
jgi:copper chaperone CopZ